MKQEFKSSLFIIIKNVIYGVCGGVVAAFIANWFLSEEISILIGAIFGLLVIYFALFSDNIKLVVDEDSDELSIYKLGKLKYQFKLSEVHLKAKIKTTYDSTGSDSDCNLYITTEDGNTQSIDCSMLGASRFYKLLDVLKVTNSDEPEKIETKKAKKNKKSKKSENIENIENDKDTENIEN